MSWLTTVVQSIQLNARLAEKAACQSWQRSQLKAIKRIASVRLLWAAMILILVSNVAAAQQGGGGGSTGICGMPGGEALVPLVMNVVSGVLVLGGVLMVGYGLIGITTNSRRGTSGRTVVITGIAALAVGLVFGQIPAWMAGIMGTSLDSLGLQCI